MRKIKKLCILFCVGVMLTCTVGCHGGKKKAVNLEVPTLDTSKQIEITFWAKNDNNVVQTNVYNQAIEDFQKLYPNITVTIKRYSDYSRIYNDVITNISTNTTPNVCITYPDHVATYITGDKTVVDLANLMHDPRYGFGGSELAYDSPTLEEVVPEFLAEGRIGGVQYAIPYMRSSEALYINKTYVEKLGYTIPDQIDWDFIWEVSEAATKKNADGTYALNGQQVMIPFIYKSTDNMMIQLLKQMEAGYSNETGEIQIFNEDTKSILYTVAEHVESGAFSTFQISSYPGNFYNAGQCIFAIDSTAGSTWLGDKAPLTEIPEETKVEFETLVRPIPQINPDNPKMISQGPSICLFNKADPQEVLASWLFAQFLLTNSVQIPYAETEGYVPVTYKAQNTPEYQDYLSRRGEDNNDHYAVKIDVTKLLLDNIGNTFVTPVFNGSASLRSASGQMIENVAKSVRRKQTVDDAYLEKMFGEVTSLYRLDQIQTDASVVADLGPLSPGAVALLVTLAVVWAILIVVFLGGILKKKKNNV